MDERRTRRSSATAPPPAATARSRGREPSSDTPFRCVTTSPGVTCGGGEEERGKYRESTLRTWVYPRRHGYMSRRETSYDITGKDHPFVLYQA